jgi:hypothetical protein
LKKRKCEQRKEIWRIYKKKKKKNWRRKRTVRKKERKSEREGDPKKII